MKKEIMRKCILTNTVTNRDNLFRIVKNANNEVKVDFTNKINGHGVYLLKDTEVIQKAKEKNILKSFLKVEIDPNIYKEMSDYLLCYHKK